MTVENTDPACFWLTNFVETLLVQVWYPMTVATHSREQKKVVAKYLDVTGDVAGLGFKLHDFGFRGVSSVETAGVGSCAHLVNFLGTDTVAGLVVAKDYYGAESAAGFSIPASEHSTITSWGESQEVDAMRNMLEVYPAGLVACVSDSYDIFKACGDLWGTQLKDAVLARDGCLVVRPDSGDPPSTAMRVLAILGDKFGKEKNDKGYWVLDSHVRVIWGDGIDYEMICAVLSTLADAGWSADNIGFGSGGGLLQKLNRDTQKCAFKCSSIVVDGAARDVFKDPVTDKGKASKKGASRSWTSTGR
ncbi:nicotinamide phosphoribosyltransferase [Aureococcus anophagefferens]|nr:nicotinamide phosphoribosyltransferase [Aureococcus anophagefferens]